MTDLTVITPPAEEPVSLSQAKDYLRIGHDGEDGLLLELISSARARLERVAGLALISRALKLTWTRWPGSLGGRGVIIAPTPATGISSVAIFDADDLSTDHTGRFSFECGRLRLRSWSMVPAVPYDGRVEIEFEAGFGSAAQVPEDLKLAVKRLIAEAYGERGLPGERGVGAPLPDDVEAIINAHRGARL
ncbi:MAG: hypothetical protein Hens3KO_04180 [Henriciella sp.]